jgi:hypothetical protein
MISEIKGNTIVKERKRPQADLPLSSFEEYADYFGHLFRQASEEAFRRMFAHDPSYLKEKLAKAKPTTRRQPVQTENIQENNNAHVIASLQGM